VSILLEHPFRSVPGDVDPTAAITDGIPAGPKVENRGLDPIKGFLGGLFIAFGAPNTPVDERRYARFNRTGEHEQDALFWPLSGVPTITNPTNFREASATGKPGGNEMFARLPNPLLNNGITSESLTLTPRATPNSARRITRAQVDPWGSTAGKPSWTPGDMAQKSVSG
jgi:hypothetical protein